MMLQFLSCDTLHGSGDVRSSDMFCCLQVTSWFLIAAVLQVWLAMSAKPAKSKKA